MALKDILVHEDGGRGHEARRALAAELASRQEAHLAGLFVIEPFTFPGVASLAQASLAAAEAAQARYRAARRAAGDALGTEFRALADRAGLASEWRVVEADPATALAHHARYADLAVVGQTAPGAPPLGAAVPDAVLMGSGRPVLVVPYIGATAPFCRRALVAWNATREATRAVHDALPLLEAAECVTVLSINPARGSDGEGALPAADIALHLARHGVKATATYTVAEDVSVGELILSRAADLAADLIVMGGYGHSRTRELVLGGTTRTLLRHMTMPVLLSH